MFGVRLTACTAQSNLTRHYGSMIRRPKHFLRTPPESAPRVLITGSLGQLGTELTRTLRQKYGPENVIATDIRRPPKNASILDGPFLYADVLNSEQLEALIVDYNIDQLVHFSALLSAVGEQNVHRALDVNIQGFFNVLELARKHNVMLFSPSTIGAFGASTPKPASGTADVTIMRPTTIYGISKVHMELLGEYYQGRYGTDFRSLRYPGIISAESEPGGGTTDYAVDIFHHALNKPDEPFKCFLSADTALPMMYLPDCLKATIDMMEAPASDLKQRTYNVNAMSFTPQQLANEIKKHFPKFEIVYEPDFRQKIADTWPAKLDDENARRDWHWKEDYGIERMVEDMLRRLGKGLPHSFSI